MTKKINFDADLIYSFATSLLSQRYHNPKATPWFHKEMWEYCCDPYPQVAIAAPRGHAKSTAITHAYVLASVLFRQSSFVVIISDTETQAIKFLNDIKMELSENEALRQLFEVKEFTKYAEREVEIVLGPDNYKFCIMVRGASGGSGAVRGFKWRGQRPDLIICDDVENDEAVMNEERRAKFREWMYGALLPSLSDEGKIRFVGTVLHFDSLLESCMPRTSGDSAIHTITDGLRQWTIDPEADWKAIKYRAHTDFDDYTELLWPEKFSRERLERIKSGYIRQGYPEGYAQEYLNYPIAASNAFFRKDDFIPMEEEDYNKFKIYYASADLAISEKDRRSYTAIVVGGMDDQGILHIVDVLRERLDGEEIIREMLNIQVKYKPELFIVEEGALRKSLYSFLQTEMHKTGIYLNLCLKVPDRDKKSRASGIQARIRQGGVRFDMKATWYPSFEEELRRFPRSEYNDQVDAIAWLGLVLADMVEAPTPEELADQEWEDEFGSEISMGRNKTTNY